MYCDTFDVACTVVKGNVHELVELEAFAELHELPIKYRLGISNKRIGSDRLLDQFSVVSDEQYKFSAVEFFPGKLSKRRRFQKNLSITQFLIGCSHLNHLGY